MSAVNRNKADAIRACVPQMNNLVVLFGSVIRALVFYWGGRGLIPRNILSYALHLL